MSQKKFQVVLLGADAKLAEAISLLVRLDGGLVSCAGTSAEALSVLSGGPADLLLLDLKSAEVESLNLLHQLRQLPLSRPVFTIGLGTGTETAALLRAFDIGLNANIQLPLENSLFSAQLRSALQVRAHLEELTRRQQELTEACRAAEVNSRAKSDFLATMSHEIRTPMNGVVAMAGLLMETPLTSDQRSYLETIHNSSESLLSIINDILDFSKIEAGKMELERRPFNVRGCVEESLDLLSARVFEKQLDLGYEADPAIPELIEGDAQRFRQVLVNLLGNALKFTERGDIFVKIRKLAPDEPGEIDGIRLQFSVRDTGIGIPADRLERLFRAFTQADVSTARKYGGSGLGLAISRRLVELMGGRMWAESIPGKGSTFHFTLAAQVAPDSSPPVHSRPLPRLTGLKILILDDNASIRNVLFELCRLWGMQPQAVETASQVMELLRSGNHFDLALVDSHLPGFDGLAVASEIQKFPNAAMLPIVLLMPLGKNNQGDGLRVMFVHTCQKPVKPAQLSTVLERALLSPRIPTKLPESPKSPLLLAAKLPLRILLVDDNHINLKVAIRLLQQLGFQPDTATNGREALEALDRQPFDLVFMDVMMPEIDGLEATRLIRQRQLAGDQKNYSRRIIIIAMTANAMQGDHEKCLAAGMDDYLAKPVRPKDVRDMVEKWGGKLAAECLPPETSPGSSPAENVPVDMACISDLTDGNMDSLRELVEMFMKQTHQQFAQMAEAIQAQNADSVRRLAHSCAGASATLGMTQLVPKLRQLEQLGATGAVAAAGPIYQAAQQEFVRIQEFLTTQPGLAEAVAKSTAA